MQEILFQYNPWWEAEMPFVQYKPRDRYLNQLKQQLNQKQIQLIIGLRRVGKTTLLKLMIKELIQAGIEPKKILYVSLDDYLLKKSSIIDIVNEYRKLHKLKFEEKITLFFDEVTSKEQYHIHLKNLYDNHNCKIFASSSSTSLLRDKQATLTGRTITLELKPLDLDEYLQFKGIEIKKRDSHLLEAHFKEYIREGGMPENVLNPNRDYLMTLVDDIIQKDITAFHALKKPQLLRDYFVLLMERSGKQLSLNKISHILKISTDTASRYMGYFEETFLIHLLPRWGKTNAKIMSPKKIYASDLAFKYLIVGERDLGSYFENYVYLKLRNKQQIYYLQEQGSEIDFYTEDQLLVEVKYQAKMNPKQEQLFAQFPATYKLLIDTIQKANLLADLAPTTPTPLPYADWFNLAD
ncbi:hypothetical protein MNBD_CHLOROFLEXI01-3217 [hydrothermal vent metagenome]|uniref:AAA+ ATPase domain-containing protein n=1 Tax=hydrothermal vent metagenome TaxID=652676 RepID=A0A3B0VRK7_9ZZZZ